MIVMDALMWRLMLRLQQVKVVEVEYSAALCCTVLHHPAGCKGTYFTLPTGGLSKELTNCVEDALHTPSRSVRLLLPQ